METLFPELPENLSELTDEQLAELLEDHKIALAKVEASDEEYIGGLSADEVLLGMEQGVEQIKAIKAEQAGRVEAEEAYQARIAELAALAAEGETEESDEADEAAEKDTEELADEDEAEKTDEADEADAAVAAEAEAIVAAAAEAAPAPAPAPAQAPQRVYRRPAPASPEREAPAANVGTALVAAAGVDGTVPGTPLNRVGLAEAMIEFTKRRAAPRKHEAGVEEKVLIATAAYDFPEEMILKPNDADGNNEKIRKIGSPYLGSDSMAALVASGGLCAPLTPLYDIPDFASTARPVRDALPSFQAERGGVSVPSVSIIGDITTAITFITEANDALGGTFATKSCQDLTCPSWTDVAVNIISHCREYGNLNARAWPEGIAHENNLTMAAHARTAETALLDRIKTLSINVTAGANTLSAWTHLVYAVTRTASSIRYLLRLEEGEPMIRALMPAWVPDLLITDQINDPFDRWQARQEVVTRLRGYGIEPTFYLDNVSSGTSQGFSNETASAVDNFPTVAQIALYPEGTFLHLDGGVLELGVVRDSTLNSTNDYQVFGETFENVARIGPAQAARWLTLTFLPVGEFPPAGTALS